MKARYIARNAMRDAWRGKGRSILVMLVVAVVSAGSAVGLSIRNAAELSMQAGMASNDVTATIGMDRSQLMRNATADGDNGTDSNSTGSNTNTNSDTSADDRREAMRKAMDGQGITLDQYASYLSTAVSKGISVSSWYTLTAGVYETDSLQPVESSSSSDSSSDSSSSDDSTDSSTGDSSNGASNDANGGMRQDGGPGGDGMQGGPGGGWQRSTGDFSLIGFSSDLALSNAENGTFTLDSGKAPSYTESDEGKVLISKELAEFNNLKVGDTVTVKVPKTSTSSLSSSDSMEYTEHKLTIAGIYENSTSDSSSSQSGMGGGPMGGNSMQDSANAIYTTVETLDSLGLAPASDGSDEDSSPAKDVSVSYTYSLADVDSYNAFKKAVDAKLSDGYTVQSRDVEQYEQSLVPLQNVERFSTVLTVVVVAIGGIVLIGVGLLSTRDRRYEVGVLTAIGVGKGKVAMQFLVEAVVVAMIGVAIGVGVGAVTGGPVSTALLSTQAASQQKNETSQREMLGRGPMGQPGQSGAGTGNNGNGVSSGGIGGPSGDTAGPGASSSVSSADLGNVSVDWTVIGQVALIGLALAVLSSMAGILYIMRYDPLRILAERG